MLSPLSLIVSPPPVNAHDLAVQDQVRDALGQRPIQRLPQVQRAGREYLDDLAHVPVCRRLQKPETPAQTWDVALIPEPRQRERGLRKQPSPRRPFWVPISQRCTAGRPDANKNRATRSEAIGQ